MLCCDWIYMSFQAAACFPACFPAPGADRWVFPPLILDEAGFRASLREEGGEEGGEDSSSTGSSEGDSEDASSESGQSSEGEDPPLLGGAGGQ
jgi:hypothetical protein